MILDAGGILPHGIVTIPNNTGRPELILTAEQWSEVVRRGRD